MNVQKRLRRERLSLLNDGNFGRVIPQVLEKLWERRAGINPVAGALFYVNERREQKLNLNRVFLWALVLGCLGTVSFALGQEWSIKQFQGIGALFFVIGVVVLFIGVVLNITGPNVKERALAEAEQFYVHLEKFIEWSEKKPRELCLSKTQLEKEASRILDEQAVRVLRHQRAAAKTAITSEQAEQRAAEKKEFDIFLERLEKLHRLSIADNDRESYFRRAARTLNDEEAELERRRVEEAHALVDADPAPV